MINNKRVNVTSNKGNGWQLFSVPGLPGTNNLTIVFNTKKVLVDNIKSSVYLVEDKLLASRKITITHAPLKPFDKFGKPYPLLQNKKRRIFEAEFVK